jgi:DNA-binding XRE family transcriptional regulator
MDRAKAIRNLRGLRTQREFASELGVRRRAVIAWEQGGGVSLHHALQLVEMGIPTEVFLEGKSTKRGATTATKGQP